MTRGPALSEARLDRFARHIVFHPRRFVLTRDPSQQYCMLLFALVLYVPTHPPRPTENGAPRSAAWRRTAA